MAKILDRIDVRDSWVIGEDSSIVGVYRSGASQASLFNADRDYSTKDYNIGVFYFPGWSTPGGGPNPANPWAVIPANRIPLIGAFDETTQANCDYNLELMRDHGIKFVAVFVYFQDGGGGRPVPYLNHFLDRYMTSKVINKPKLCLSFVAQTNAFLYNPTTWVDVYKSFFPYFRDPNYFWFEGKPAVNIFDVPSFHTCMTDASGANAALSAARAAAQTEFGGIHFIGCTSAAGEFWQGQITSAGWDGITSYTIFSKTEVFGDAQATSKTGYERLDDAVYGANEVISGPNYHSWFGTSGHANPPPFPAATLQGNGIAARISVPYVWAPIMSGWDARPWDAGDTLNAIPTDAQFETHLLKARGAIDAHRSKTKGVGIITAWNEFGEGQFIQPTVSNGMGRLLAIKRVFGQ